MLGRSTGRVIEEDAFTLIELLVVILIIGILAAIALPTFLNQANKATDAGSKSNARNLVSFVESCATDTGGDYTSCGDSNLSNTGLSLGTGAGQVHVVSSSTTGYTVTAYSTVGGSSPRSFTITNSSGTITRTCTPAGSGGCPSAGTW